MMLPRYQRSGDDGYFLARPVKGFWLGLSAMLRRLRLQWLVRILPGVWRHPSEHDHLVVHPPKLVGGSHARNVFHLFGYRRVTGVDRHDNVIYTRRRPDSLGPRNLPPELDAALDASDNGVSGSPLGE